MAANEITGKEHYEIVNKNAIIKLAYVRANTVKHALSIGRRGPVVLYEKWHLVCLGITKLFTTDNTNKLLTDNSRVYCRFKDLPAAAMEAMKLVLDMPEDSTQTPIEFVANALSLSEVEIGRRLLIIDEIKPFIISSN